MTISQKEELKTLGKDKNYDHWSGVRIRPWLERRIKAIDQGEELGP